jgi:hypothetical protein
MTCRPRRSGKRNKKRKGEGAELGCCGRGLLGPAWRGLLGQCVARACSFSLRARLKRNFEALG